MEESTHRTWRDLCIYILLIGEEGQEYTFKNRSERVIRITVFIPNNNIKIIII